MLRVNQWLVHMEDSYQVVLVQPEGPGDPVVTTLVLPDSTVVRPICSRRTHTAPPLWLDTGVHTIPLRGMEEVLVPGSLAWHPSKGLRSGVAEAVW